jgi:hypothetical protein
MSATSLRFSLILTISGEKLEPGEFVMGTVPTTFSEISYSLPGGQALKECQYWKRDHFFSFSRSYSTVKWFKIREIVTE